MLIIDTSISLPKLPNWEWLSRLVGRLSRQAVQYHQHRVMLNDVAHFSDHLLKDIGVEKQLGREAALFDPAARTDGLWFPPISLH